MAGTRRRGAELEAAIRATVLAQIDELGYSGVTFEGVAAAAGTSKAVLYRRWSTKAEMVFAAVTDRVREVIIDIPDAGSLSADLRSAFAWVRDQLGVVGRATMLGLISEIDGDDGKLVRELLFQVGSDLVEPIVVRARERGELGATELPPWLLAAPFDLVRHDLLIAGELPDERIELIVNDLAIPAWTAYSRR